MARTHQLVAVADARESTAWRWFLLGFLKSAPTPVMRVIRQRMPSTIYEEFDIVGRRSGLTRRLLLNLYEIDGTWYAGHPNGTSQWVRNLVAAGGCTVTRRDGIPVPVTAVEVTDPDERELVIRASGRQPLPAGPVYRAATRHIRAVGRFFRLEPLPSSGLRRE